MTNDDMLYTDFSGIRNDGREFSGTVVKVVKTVRGTLVTLMQYGETGKEYKNVYLEECRDWGVERFVNI